MFSKSDKFMLGAAFASFLFSVYLWFFVDHEAGSFVGLWVPSILALWVGVHLCIRRFESKGESHAKF